MADAGWYDDPADGTHLRWYDGSRWTTHRAPKRPSTAESGWSSADASASFGSVAVAPSSASVRSVPAVGFTFDGGAGTHLGTSLLAFLVTVLTLGICYPYAIVLRQRWIAKHTMINGVRLRFTGTAIGLFGNWLKWLGLIIITIGIYLFWVGPRVRQWIVVHTEFDRTSTPPDTFTVAGVPYRRVA